MSRLEDNKLWQMAARITEQAYALADELPEEEKWGMQAKLRSRALDLHTDVAEAVGSIDPRDSHYHFGHAKRSLFGVKSMYLVASNTGMLTVEPEAMLAINKLSDALDTKIDEAAKAIPDFLQQYTGGGKSNEN